MPAEIRRLHRLSWLFMMATSVKALIVPLIAALFASSQIPMVRFELVGLLILGPAFVVAFLQQRIYNYRFGDDELVIRDGILTKTERHIPYDRVHNVVLVRNPFHRMLGVASARVETAAGGKPEAVMRVLSLEAVEELQRHTLGKQRPAIGSDPDGIVATEDGATVATAPEALSVRLRVPAVELVRLGLISNRGLVVVAVLFSVLSQIQWWNYDWEGFYNTAREIAPGLFTNSVTESLLQPGSWTPRILIALGLIVLFVVALRVLSVAWYLVNYYGFTLEHEDKDLRTEFGLLTRVSSLIPVHRIQLLTTSASLLHRCFGRMEIDLETAGGMEEGDGTLTGLLAESGIKTTRQWLVPIIGTDAANALVRSVMPEIDIDAVEWRPISPKAAMRIIKKSVLVVALITASLASVLAFAPVPGGGLLALWLPALALPLIYFAVTGWVRHAAYALTETAIFFRSGWLARNISVVRFDKMQSVWLSESPFDRRHHMACVKVDTAGAGSMGHRIDIPYLDLDEARAMTRELYREANATEFRW